MKTKEFRQSINFYKIDSLRLGAFIVLFLVTATLRAGDEYFYSRLKGSQLVVPATCNSHDTMFQRGLSPDWITSNKIRYQRVTNQIILKVDTAVFSPENYTCTIGLEVKFKDKDNHTKTYTPSLTVEFQNGTTATEKDQVVYQFYGGHDVTVKIISINNDKGNGVVTAVAPNNLILENKIKVNRFYDMNTNYPGALTLVPKNGGNELELKWPRVLGAEEYQLEWIYVNDYDGTSPGGSINTTNLSYDFRGHATRVTFPDSILSYTVSNVYEKGYVIFRHRAIGRTGAGNKIPVLGSWSAPDSGLVASFFDLRSYRVNAHEQDKMNWMYTAAYAEEGKKKENVTYMDGTSRARQSVSKLNTENQTIVSETIYDKEGRPAISVMPSPSNITSLLYNKNYNRNSGGDDYSSIDFESNTDPCVKQASALDVNSGSSRYFSPANPVKKGMQAYLPDAAGFPFSQTEYTPDNTGRIKRQGGVGPTFQLNSGHETNNYYGKPVQEHLDRLFGSEAGYYSHYQKNMVRDPNGQLHVSYVDMNGRTVATALAGATTSNLDPVYDASSMITTTVNVLDNQPVVKGDRSIHSQFVYLANSTGDHIFNYSVAAPFYGDENCLSDANICFDCVYDLEISVKDDCGAERIPGGPIKKTVGMITDYLCGKAVPKLAEVCTVNIDKTGTYYINKTLSVNQKALNDGLAFYLKNKKCVKTYNEYVKEELAKADFTGCEESLNCDEICIETIGTEEVYLTNNPGKTAKDYKREMLACQLDCKVAPKLTSIRESMLLDLSPGGQYADTTVGPDGVVRSKDFTSIYHAFNLLGANLLQESIVFRDKNGKKDSVTMPGGEKITPNKLFGDSLELFIHEWKPSWAEALFRFHPEYEYWLAYTSDFRDQADAYESLMLGTETYEEALRLGLLNPLCLTDVPVPIPTDANSDPLPFVPKNLGEPHMDPYFSDFGHDNKDAMTSYMKNLTMTKSGSTIKGLWQIAASSVICNNPDISTPAACAAACSSYVFSPINSTDICTVDRVWKMFRSLYLAKRDSMVETEIENIATITLGGTSNKNIGTSGNFASKQKRFPALESDLKLQVGPNVLSTNITDINNNKTMQQGRITAQCDQTCANYADTWMIKLSGCNPGGAWDNTNSTYNELRAKLIAVCKAGCDAEHSLGSSSVPPGNPGIPSDRGIPNYKSFSDVIKGIFGTDKIECTADLITMPVAYKNDEADFTAPGIMDTCACDKVLYIDKYYNEMVVAHTLPAGMTKVKLFKQIYKMDVDELNGKVCLCKNALSKGGVSVWNPNVNWSIAGVNFLATVKEPIQPSLNCEKCTNCAVVRDVTNKLKNKFEAIIGGPIPASKTKLFENIVVNHLNDSLNMDISYLQYKLFLIECNKAATGGYTCKAGPAAEQLEKMLNLLTFKNELVTKAYLCEPPYTPATLSDKNKFNFSYTDLLASKVDPVFNPASCNQVYCFDYTAENTLHGFIKSNNVPKCSLELSFTEPGFLFENIRQLSHLTIDPKNTGSNYNFIVKAAVAVEDHMEYVYLNGKTTCIPLGECSTNDNTLTLCSNSTDPDEDKCVENITTEAFTNAYIRYTNFRNREKNEFVTRYIDRCLTAADSEKFSMKFFDGEYNYTLYYYDQAGNLVRTVPPEGVEFVKPEDLAQVAKDRENQKRTIFTKHRMATTYTYNTLNQLVNQSVPDHDQLNNWATYPNTSGLPSDLQIVKAQNNKEGGTYFISDVDANKSAIYYAPDGVSWSPVTDFGLTNMSAVNCFGTTCYAVGDNGALLKTTDGTNWVFRSTGINDDLREVYFSSATNGIIVTSNVKLYRTVDAGNTWTPVTGSGLDLDIINELTFATATNGIAVGSKGVNGAVYRTTDGGLTWTAASSFTTNDLKTVQVLPDNSTAYAGGVKGTLIKSTNAGKDWSDVSSNLVVNLKEIHFAEEFIGCALGEDGILYKTTTGGYQWDPALNPTPGDKFADVHFPNATVGYAVSQKGEVWITKSGGAYWKWIRTVTSPSNFTVVFFERDDLGYVAGENGKLYKITKDPVFDIYSHASIASGTTINFAALHFNGSTGSALSSNGFVMKSTGGGAGWNNVSPFVNVFTSFSFASPTVATATTANGKTAYTVDAGQTWTAGPDLMAPATVITTNTNGNYVAVGSGGTIFSSLHFGSDWENVTKNVKPLTLRGAFMKTAAVAYATGLSGSLYRTSDGGINWKAIPTNTKKSLEDVGESAGNVVLCGNSGAIEVTSNVLAALPDWTSANVSGSTKQNRHIAFSGVKGYITTSAGKILVSNNNGVEWSEYYPGTVPLSGLYMISESLGYAVGQKGNVIKITPAPGVSLIKGMTPAKLNDTHCEGNFAIAVGNNVNLKSTDGGQSWKSIVTASVIRAVSFVEPQSGDTPDKILIAGNGFVSISTNGGDNYTPVSSPAITASTNISALCMVDNEKVYAIGDNGIIRRSTNGGSSWSTIASPVATDLTAITIKGKVGFITGKGGVILKSEDAFATNPNWTPLLAQNGDNWVKYITHLTPTPNLNSVYFHDYTTGYVAGDKGVVLKTMNGGISWEQMLINGIEDLKYISFHSDIQGNIFGGNTTVLAVMDDKDNISTRFYYDRLGRLVASQNTKQYRMSQPRYSYTRYDEQNRVIETGEVATNHPNLDKYLVNAPNFPDNMSQGKYNVVRTYYDEPMNGEVNNFFGTEGQQNLRSRISSVTIQEVYDPAKLYDHATHYSYDVHGNVKSVIQDNPELE